MCTLWCIYFTVISIEGKDKMAFNHCTVTAGRYIDPLACFRYVLLAVAIPIIILVIFIVVVNNLQVKKPDSLPKKLQSWDFLPLGLRSLEPYDRLFKAVSILANHRAAIFQPIIELQYSSQSQSCNSLANQRVAIF